MRADEKINVSRELKLILGGESDSLGEVGSVKTECSGE